MRRGAGGGRQQGKKGFPGPPSGRGSPPPRPRQITRTGCGFDKKGRNRGPAGGCGPAGPLAATPRPAGGLAPDAVNMGGVEDNYRMSEESAREWATMDEDRKRRALAVLAEVEAESRMRAERAATNARLIEEVMGKEFLEKFGSG